MSRPRGAAVSLRAWLPSSALRDEHAPRWTRRHPADPTTVGYSEEFHFEDETAGIKEPEDPQAEADIKHPGEGWIGCAIGVCLAAPYAVINLCHQRRVLPRTVDVSTWGLSSARAPTRPRAPPAFPTRPSSALRQLAQHVVILRVGVDRRLRIRRFERLLEQTDLASHARREPVEGLHDEQAQREPRDAGSWVSRQAVRIGLVHRC